MGAYWLSPKGDIIEVDSRHIHSIISYPKKFGIPMTMIESAYRKHKEPLGSEGDAREEILIRLMEKGWIRIRYINRQYSVVVQLSDVFYAGGSWKHAVSKWSRYAVKDGSIPETVSVTILDLGGGRLWPEQQLYELAAGSLTERRKVGTFAEFLNPVKKKRRRGAA
jgi:hypothetical protein